MKNFKAIFTIGATFLVGACSVFGQQGVDIAPYDTVMQSKDFEIREYPPMVLVETYAEGDYDAMQDTAFNRLFDYISGENKAREEIAMTAPVMMDDRRGQKIPMTAPVLMDGNETGWTMAFVLPEKYTLESAPQPMDSEVILKETEPQIYAVVTFSGFLNEKSIRKNRERLNAWIDENDYEKIGDARIAGYDPPWTLPMMRRNEIHIPVRR